MILSLSDYTLKTPDGRILKEGLSFDFAQGEVLLISGPNGSGKTTLLNVLAPRLQAFKDLEYIPQLSNIHSFIPLTILDLILLSHPNLTEEDILELGLVQKDHLERAWATASGGERKRALLTKAIVANPALMILDEPLNHLDNNSARLLLELCKKRIISGELKGLILVAHQAENFSILEESSIAIRKVEL